MTETASKADLKGLRAQAKKLDDLREDEFYCEDSGSWKSKGYTKLYELLEHRFISAVNTSAKSRKVEYDRVIDMIYS